MPKAVATLVLYALAYVLAVRLGYAFRLGGGGASPFWPAAGLSLAALLLRPSRHWPLYFGIAMAGSAYVKHAVEGLDAVTVGMAAPFDAVGPVVAAWWLRRRTSFDPTLPRVHDLMLLGCVAFFIATPLAAGFGALRIVREHPAHDFFSVFQTWLLGDALGILLFAPPILVTASGHAFGGQGGRSGTWLAFAVVGLLGLGTAARVNPGLAVYLASPILCFAAYRFGLRATSYLAALFSTTAVVAVHRASGLAGASVSPNTALQLFGFSSVAMVLLASALDEQRAQAAAHLRIERSSRTAQKFEALGRLSSGVAHDFNNVLSTVVASAELIQMQDGNAEASRLADEILAASSRGADIVRQLMVYGRRDVGAPTPCDLVALLRRDAPMLARLTRTPVDLELRIETDDAVVVIDETALVRVLMNLVSNARAVSPEGAPVILTLRRHRLPSSAPFDHRPHTPLPPALREGDYACITVEDSGSGMSEAIMQRIFEPFFTTKPEGEGTGLGLATAYSLALAAGGAIVAASELGVGTAMHLVLPIAGDSSSA